MVFILCRLLGEGKVTKGLKSKVREPCVYVALLNIIHARNTDYVWTVFHLGKLPMVLGRKNNIELYYICSETTPTRVRQPKHQNHRQKNSTTNNSDVVSIILLYTTFHLQNSILKRARI